MKNIETVKSVKHKLPPNHSPFPNGYLNVSSVLPLGCWTIITLTSMSVIEGRSKELAIVVMDILLDGINEPLFIDFDNPENDFKKDSEKDEYEYQYKRELDIKTELEKHGYFYPTNIREGIDLLVKLGLLFEEEKDGKIYFDVLIAPYPTADELFKKRGD